MSTRRFRSPASLCTLALVLAGCVRRSPEPQPPSQQPLESTAAAPVTVRILYTSDEHGWVAPVADAGKPFRGGAAALLTLWKQREGHCVPSAADACEQAETLALSGGDNWTGPALSSFFQGEVAALSMRQLGYAASALGNHELDFGRKLFDRNRALEGFPYVGANVEPPVSAGGVTHPFVLLKRRGVVFGVVGLSTSGTPKAGMRENYVGLTFGDEEAALARAIPAAYAAGAQVVVVIAHVCADELLPIVERHPEWKLGFAGGGHCHKLGLKKAGEVDVIDPGSFLKNYVRVTLTLDGADHRVIRRDVTVVDLSYPEGGAPLAPPDPELARLVAGWQEKADAALGEVIGFTGEAIDSDSPPLTNFITDRWREAVSADVAILNRFGTRQAIPKGPIKLETIFSVLPFNNHLVTVKVTGAQLVKDVKCCNGHVSGVTMDDEGKIVMANGDAIDPEKRYTVVTTDYAYGGGSDFPFEKQDPNGVVGEDWREPLIRWLRKNRTTEARGLEAMVDKVLRVKPPKRRKAKP